MEKYHLADDVRVICNKAKTFPEGVMKAFTTLESSVPDMGKRATYGISKPDEQQVIIYKAAVTELADGEAERLGMEAFTIRKGNYMTETIMDWQNHIQAFGQTFQKLLDNPRLDWDSPCVEWYKSDEEVMCMVRILD